MADMEILYDVLIIINLHLCISLHFTRIANNHGFLIKTVSLFLFAIILQIRLIIDQELNSFLNHLDFYRYSDCPFLR